MDITSHRVRRNRLIALGIVLLVFAVLVYFDLRGSIVALFMTGILTITIVVGIVQIIYDLIPETVTYLGDVACCPYPTKGTLKVSDGVCFRTESGEEFHIHCGSLRLEGGVVLDRDSESRGRKKILTLYESGSTTSPQRYRFRCHSVHAAREIAKSLRALSSWHREVTPSR